MTMAADHRPVRPRKKPQANSPESASGFLWHIPRIALWLADGRSPATARRDGDDHRADAVMSPKVDQIW